MERIDQIKSDDPHRLQIVDMFKIWYARHGEKPVKVKAIAGPVRTLLDPQGRGRQFTAARLVQLAGTRADGFVLTRAGDGGHWSVEPRADFRYYSAARGTIQGERTCATLPDPHSSSLYYFSLRIVPRD